MMRDLVDQMGGTHGRPPRHTVADDDRVECVKLHDFTVALHYDTGKAVLISETGEEAKAVWLPKSELSIRDLGRTTPAIKKGGVRVPVRLIEITVPDWLAKNKGLI